MNVQELQAAIGAVPDGAFGPASTSALLAHFSNKQARAVRDADIAVYAAKLGCTADQVKAVAAVESSGSGFDKSGRPKILYERHLFHRLTDGKYSPAPYSQSAGGGYGEDSWHKLAMACARDPDAAFAACSWGKFQVLGMHWSKLGYAGPFDLADSCVTSEAAHYDLLVRYVQTFGLTAAIRKISRDPEDCRDFAAGFNGPAYRKFNYHARIAAAMA